jgi:hypothetical protein
MAEEGQIMPKAPRLFVAACFLVLALAASPAEARRRVYIRIAPPRVAIVETRPVAPSPRHVWVGGFNRWDGRAYVWVPGRWDLAPRARHAWVPGHWRHNRHGWYWVNGHWR